MTPRQRRIIGVLVVANVIFLTVALILAKGCRSPVPFSSSTSPWGLPSAVPTYRPPMRFLPVCRRRAVEMLAEAGLGGTVTLADQTVRFDLVYRVTKGRHTEDVAQRVWTAFDVALALADEPCDAFSRIEIVIEAQGAPRLTRVYAAVDTADLEAYHGGEMSERTFIDRVQYRTEPIDGS